MSVNRRKTMTNPIVLDYVAGFLQGEDLTNLRRTCALWNSSFIPNLRRKHNRIVLTPWPGQEGYHRYVDGDGHNMMEFCSLMKCSKSAEMPFSRYQLRVDPSDEWFDISHFKYFVSMCGQTITSLHIQCCLEVEWENSAIRSAIFGQMPHLKELRLWITGYEPEHFHDKMVVLSNEFPDQIPRLKRLAFEYSLPNMHEVSVPILLDVLGQIGWSELEELTIHLSSLEWPDSMEEGTPLNHYPHDLSYDTFVREVLTRIEEGASQNCISTLKYLRIGEVGVETWRVLLGLGLRLERFSIPVTGHGWEQHRSDVPTKKEETLSVFRAFLTTQAETLRALTLGWRHQDGPEDYDPHFGHLAILPPMKLLCELKTGSIFTEIWNPPCLHFDDQSVSFANNFPSLKKLRYFATDENLIDGGNKIEHPGVTHLCVSVTVENLPTLRAAFPSVAHLEICIIECGRGGQQIVGTIVGLSDCRNSQLWTLWPNLTKLKTKFDQVG